MQKQEFKKMREKEDSETSSKVPTSKSQGCQKEKRKSKKLKTQLKKKMKENFSNLAKERDIRVQEAQSPKQDRPKDIHTKTHHN